MIRTVRQVCATLRQVLIGASGLDAYEIYLEHCRRTHPRDAPLSRQEFFRNDLTARWDGIKRCC